MKFKLFLFFLFFSMIVFGQNIKKHQWKNSVLLVYTNTVNNSYFKNQTLILQEHKKEILERKLLVYCFTKDAYSVHFKDWQKSNFLYKKYVHNLKNFKVLLLGLDGGIKLEQNSVLKTDKLFTTIDRMPIRKRELKNNN